MKHLIDLNIIRIVIWYGDGFGNERASIVVMENLRYMGFQGKFDIRYATYSDFDTLTGDGVGEKLRTLIHGFIPINLYGADKNYIYHSGWNNLHPILGDITVTRLPPPLQQFALPRVKVTISGACDNVPMIMCKKFNTDYYVQLQPTDWPARRYIAYIEDSNPKEISLPANLRLSLKTSSILELEKNLELSIVEQQIYSLCENIELNSQLVYGLYERGLNPILECQRLLEAHRLLQEKTKKKSILFFPQEICIDISFQNALTKIFNNLFWLDLTHQTLETRTIEEMPNDAIIMAYTGVLQSITFNHLMLKKTKLPPIVEGGNARELCESLGRPYLYGCRTHDDLERYNVHIDYLNTQDLHYDASRCLKNEQYKEIRPLAEYMEQSIELKLENYHENRREEYLKRPDATEYAFEKVNIMLETFNHASSSTIIPTFAEEDETGARLAEMMVLLRELQETLATARISINDIKSPPAHVIHESRNDVVSGEKVIIPNISEEFPENSHFEDSSHNIEIVSGLEHKEPTDNAMKKKQKQIDAYQHTIAETANNTKEVNNIRFILGCCASSVGVCIAFIVNRQHQNNPSTNPMHFGLFCGFAASTGLIVTGGSLIAHSLFTKHYGGKSQNEIPKPVHESITNSTHYSI